MTRPKKTAPRWLDRQVACAGPFLCLCLSEQESDQAFRHLKSGPPPQWIGGSSDATTHIMHNPDGGCATIVCMKVRPGVSGVQIAAMLVHEAVHVWQAHLKHIGEDEPGCEQEAYGIQHIAQRLMGEYARRVAP